MKLKDKDTIAKEEARKKRRAKEMREWQIFSLVWLLLGFIGVLFFRLQYMGEPISVVFWILGTLFGIFTFLAGGLIFMASWFIFLARNGPFI